MPKKNSAKSGSTLGGKNKHMGLHDKLMQKDGMYARWHKHPFQSIAQWVFLLAVVGGVGYLLLNRMNDPLAQNYGLSSSAKSLGDLPELNDRVTKELKGFERGEPGEKTRKTESLRQILTARKTKILERMESGDKNVSSQFMPEEIRSRMPDTLRDLLEEKVEASGELSVLYVDGIKEEDSRIEYELDIKDDTSENTEKQRVFFEKGREPKVRSGSRVKVKGYSLDNKLFALSDSGQPSAQVISQPVLSDVAGTKSLLVVLLNFANDASQPFTRDAVYGSVFTNPDSTNALIKEGSYNKVSLSGTVTNWITLNTSVGSVCDTGTWINMGEQAAASYNPSGYNYVQFIFNGISTSVCNWGGQAYVGGNRSWINGMYAAHGSKAHELGHNFGAYHAGFYDCGGAQISSSCSFNEYGEYNSKMGAANNFQFNPVHRIQFAWIPSSQVQAVNSSGSYTISRDYSTSTAPKVLKINKPDTGEVYYVAYKQAAGFNASVGEGNTKGVSIYVMPSGGFYSASKLLSLQSGGGYTNSALWDGGSFTDSVNGITVNQVSHTEDSVTVSVSLSTPACSPANPTVIISPATSTGKPGAAKAYTVSVTNNNSTYCNSSTFSITPNVSSGFTSSVNSVNLPSGATQNSSITVTSGISTPDGSYGFNVTVSDNSNPGYSATANATYVVYNPPVDATAPAVNITNPADGSKVTSNSRVDVRATASDNIGVAKVEFYIDGKRVSTDTSSPYSYRWSLSRKTAAGKHTIMAKAYDAAGNSASSSISVTK